MSGFYATQQLALQALLEAAPLYCRPTTWETLKNGKNLGFSESSTAEGARGPCYDIQIEGTDSWEPQTDNTFNASMAIVCVFYFPIKASQARLSQQMDLSDYAESIRVAVLNTSNFDARARGLHRVIRFEEFNLLSVEVPFGLVYEEDAK